MKEKILLQTKVFMYVGFDEPKPLLCYNGFLLPSRLNDVVRIDSKKYRIVDIVYVLSDNLVRKLIQVSCI